MDLLRIAREMMAAKTMREFMMEVKM